MKSNETTKLIISGIIISFIVGLFLNNILNAIRFSLTFSLLFYIPIVPWTLKLKKLDFFEKIILTILLGISLIPILYSIIGFFTPLNTILFIIPSLIVFLTGIYYKKV